ncbi:MAG: pitrilysin family protein [Cytophagales bacterium]|nr:insulinase family protein [Bernardetiaceae bacterium]MDW8211699.1 pitrilysin family protein [Cytophagales bacterium]
MKETLDRTKAPTIYSLEDFLLPRPERFILPNGAKLYLLGSGVQPVVNVQINFSTGRHVGKQKAIAFLTSKMLLEGTAQHSATALTEAIDYLGASIELHCSTDHSEIEFYCLRKHLPAMLEIVCQMLKDSVFPPSQLDKLKKITTQNIRINLEKTSFVATNLLKENLFGREHPYGSVITEEQVNSCQVDEIVQFYREFYADKPFEVIAVGQLSPEEVGLFASTLGALPILTSMPETLSGEALPNQVFTLSQPKEGAVQSSVRIGKVIPLKGGKHHSDYLALSMLVEALGGYFGSRLMQNIREQKGLTYGIYAHLNTLQQATYLAIGADVKKELQQVAIEEIFKEIEKLTTTPLTREEVERVRRHMQGTFISSLNTIFGIGNCYKSIYYYQLPENYYDCYVSSLEKITTEDLLAMAQKYLQGGFGTVSVG